MRKIYKYPMGVYPMGLGALIDLPAEAKFLSFQLQNEMMCAWFEVETENPVRTLQQGPYVWHLYKVNP